MSCIISMKEKKMNNLNEDIINNYLTGQCSEEEIIQLNQWIKESDENARQLFRMEEAFHAGRFSCYENEERMARAEKRNQWIKESDENARQLFRMEEAFHAGRFSCYENEERMARAEKRLYKALEAEQNKQKRILRMHNWMKYAAALTALVFIGTGVGVWLQQHKSSTKRWKQSKTNRKEFFACIIG